MERQIPEPTCEKHNLQYPRQLDRQIMPDHAHTRSTEPGNGTHEHDQEMEPPPVRPRPAMFIIPLLLLATLGAIGALPRYFQQQELFSHKAFQLSQPISVSYVPAAPSPEVQEFVLPGSTEAILSAPVYARVDGYLHLRNVNIGDTVRTGQVMAEIETPELDKQVQAADSTINQTKSSYQNANEALQKAKAEERAAAANVKKAESDLAFAKLEYGRYEELVRSGAVSSEERDNKFTGFKGATALLESSQHAQKSAAAQIKSAEAAVLTAKAGMGVAESTRDQYAATRGFRQVKAPFDGVVTQRNVDPGSLITAGSSAVNTVLFRIGKTDVLRIYAYIPEQYISEVHAGQDADLSFQSFPGERFTGTVTYVAGGLDPVSRTLQAEIHVPNTNHRLLPGMYAQVHFKSLSKLRLPIVPGSSVQFVADGCFLYTIDDQNRARMHKVEIARDLGGKVEILHGISVGDKVIVSPPDDVVDGARVNPVLLPPPRAAS